MRAIREKLTTRPDEFGRPLHGGMRGFWKLRIGEFRVIYTIKKSQVLVYVIMVGFRRDKEVYRQALARLAKQVEEAT